MALKENQHVQPVIDVEAGTVTFLTKGMPDQVLDINKCHPNIIKRAALVGMAQVRIVDRAAVGMADDDGNIIPEDERIRMKHERMGVAIAHYESGIDQWKLNVSGVGGGKSITIEAIAQVQGIDYDTAKANVEKFAETGKDGKGRAFGGDTKKALAFLRTGARVSAAMEEIRKKRLPAPKVDADAALAELGSK